MPIEYTKGFKYRLTKTYVYQTALRPVKAIRTRDYILTTKGLLIICAGYTWDGSSGPAFDTLKTQRASLVHDVLCESIQKGLLERVWKRHADVEYLKICIENKVFPPMTIWRYAAIRAHDWENTPPRKIIIAP